LSVVGVVLFGFASERQDATPNRACQAARFALFSTAALAPMAFSLKNGPPRNQGGPFSYRYDKLFKTARQHLDAASDVATAIGIGGEHRCRTQEKSGGDGELDRFRFHDGSLMKSEGKLLDGATALNPAVSTLLRHDCVGGGPA
jgi:hypothetical protein